jgi:hypothetical protein
MDSSEKAKVCKEKSANQLILLISETGAAVMLLIAENGGADGFSV